MKFLQTRRPIRQIGTLAISIFLGLGTIQSAQAADLSANSRNCAVKAEPVQSLETIKYDIDNIHENAQVQRSESINAIETTGALAGVLLVVHGLVLGVVDILYGGSMKLAAVELVSGATITILLTATDVVDRLANYFVGPVETGTLEEGEAHQALYSSQNLSAFLTNKTPDEQLPIVAAEPKLASTIDLISCVVDAAKP